MLTTKEENNHDHITWCRKVKVKVTQLCPTLCNPMGLVHGILQARILEWVSFPFSRRSSQPKDRTQVSHNSGRGVQSNTINWQVSCLDQRSLWCGKFVMQNCSYEQSYSYLLICKCMYFSWVHIMCILLNYRAWIHSSSVYNAKHFCKLVVPIYCSTSRLWGFSLLYITLLLFL